MLLNGALVLLLFGARRTKLHPAGAALLLGFVKAALVFFFSQNVPAAFVTGVVYAALGFGFVYFFARLERREKAEPPQEVPMYRSMAEAPVKFRWEYLPLIALLVLIIAGEFLVRLVV